MDSSHWKQKWYSNKKIPLKNSYNFKKITIETDKNCLQIFHSFVKENNHKSYSRSTSLGALFTERYKRTFKDLLKETVFERNDAIWVDVLPTKTKQNNIQVHSSTQLTPVQASFKKNEGFVYRNLLDKGKKNTPKYKIGVSVRTSGLKKIFSKGHTTNWSFDLYEITEIMNDSIPSYKIDQLPQRYTEALLKNTKVIMKEKISVMRK